MTQTRQTPAKTKKTRTRVVILERWDDGDVIVKHGSGGLMRAVFPDATDLAQLGIYLPKRGSDLKMRITCEILGKS